MTLQEARQELVKEMKRLKINMEAVNVSITQQLRYSPDSDYEDEIFSITICSMKRKYGERISVPNKTSLEHAVEQMKLRLKFEKSFFTTEVLKVQQ